MWPMATKSKMKCFLNYFDSEKCIYENENAFLFE